MKKFNLRLGLMMLFIALSLNGISQTVPFVTWYSTHDYDASIVNLTDWTQVSGGGAGYYGYEPVCEAYNDLDLKITFPNTAGAGDFRYQIDIYKVAYTGTWPAHDPGNMTATHVWNSGVTTGSGFPLDIEVFHTIQVDPDYYYYAKVRYKKRGWTGIWPIAWNTGYTNNINIMPGGAPTTVEATPVNHTNTVTMPSYYGSADVYVFGDCTGNVNWDATNSSCDDRWMYSIEEFDLATWTTISTPYSSGWIFTPADQIDFSTVYSLEAGKVYRVSFSVGLDWDTESHFFSMGDPISDISLNPSNFTYYPTKAGLWYPVNEYCDNVALIGMNPSQSDCYSEYKYTVQEVSKTTLAPIGSPVLTVPSSGYLTGPASNPTSFWTNYLTVGKMYKVTFTTKSGTITDNDIHYVTRTICRRGQENIVISEGVIDENEEVLLYPNPAENQITLEVPYNENGNEVVIFNTAGQQVYSNIEMNQVVRIDLSDFEQGMYIVQVKCETGIINTKFTKQ